nr:MAG: hypothetical protein [Molluscum contagiosum virus]WQH58167.1 MAG: hypothetical protein [Molluscum contagiosum virus]
MWYRSVALFRVCRHQALASWTRTAVWCRSCRHDQLVVFSVARGNPSTHKQRPFKRAGTRCRARTRLLLFLFARAGTWQQGLGSGHEHARLFLRGARSSRFCVCRHEQSRCLFPRPKSVCLPDNTSTTCLLCSMCADARHRASNHLACHQKTAVCFRVAPSKQPSSCARGRTSTSVVASAATSGARNTEKNNKKKTTSARGALTAPPPCAAPSRRPRRAPPAAPPPPSRHRYCVAAPGRAPVARRAHSRSRCRSKTRSDSRWGGRCRPSGEGRRCFGWFPGTEARGPFPRQSRVEDRGRAKPLGRRSALVSA